MNPCKLKNLIARPLAMVIHALFAVALAGGCATQPDKIGAQSVPHHQFRDLDCAEVIREIRRVDNRGEDLYKVLYEEASTDEGQVAVGLILFWPALLLLEGGDGAEAAEYGRLQGEHRELMAEATRKNCDLSSLPSDPFYERMKEWRKEQNRKSR